MRDPIIVDDFYKEPYAIRDFALALPKLDFPGAPYVDFFAGLVNEFYILKSRVHGESQVAW